MRFEIDRSALENLDDEVIVQDLAIPIGDQTRLPTGPRWTAYSTNPHLTAAQINIVLIGEVLVEVLNGGLFQLIMNPSGAAIPDFPSAFQALGRSEEANILSRVVAMFPDEETLRDHERRLAFTSTKIVPGGWGGLTKSEKTEARKELTALEERLSELIQSAEFFAAVADYVRGNSASFAIVDR
jgi:Domain of unknown function (DUF4375)